MNHWFYKFSLLAALICFVTPGYSQEMFHALSVKNDGGILEESICDWTGHKDDDPINCRVLRQVSPDSIQRFIEKLRGGKTECEIRDATDSMMIYTATTTGAIAGALVVGFTPITLGRAMLRGGSLTAIGLISGLMTTLYFSQYDCPSRVEKLMTRFYAFTVARVPDGYVRTEKIPNELYSLVNQ